MGTTRDDPRIRDGFASPADLYDWARRDKDGRGMPDNLLRQMAAVAFHDYEKTYPSKAQLEAECVKAAALARKLTKKMSDEDVVCWIANQWKKMDGPNMNDINVVPANDKRAHDKVRRQNGILPVMVSSMDEPERMICHRRYGKSQLPNGQIVLQPVADAYIAVILEKRDRGEAVRAERRARLAQPAPEAAPLHKPKVGTVWPGPADIEAARALKRARAVKARWRKAIRMVIRQNRADALANKDNAAAAEAQRKVREAAEASAAAKQPRAYTASGPSHKEGAPAWAEEPADAADQAKEEVRRDTSKAAQAQAIADKKRAEKEATAHRLWQLEQIRKGEEIGGSK